MGERGGGYITSQELHEAGVKLGSPDDGPDKNGASNGSESDDERFDGEVGYPTESESFGIGDADRHLMADEICGVR